MEDVKQMEQFVNNYSSWIWEHPQFRDVKTKFETLQHYCDTNNILISPHNNIKMYNQKIYYGYKEKYFGETIKALEFMDSFSTWLKTQPKYNRLLIWEMINKYSKENNIEIPLLVKPSDDPITVFLNQYSGPKIDTYKEFKMWFIDEYGHSKYPTQTEFRYHHAFKSKMFI